MNQMALPCAGDCSLLGRYLMPIQMYFARSQNPDLSTDSICMDCYRMVASTRSEAELLAAEQGHVCAPDYRERSYEYSQQGTF
jgi:hypothetical protein